MEFAIIAAGEGSRLRNEGFKFSKPMVVLHQLTLIERLIQIFANNNASKIHVIINESSPELQAHLASIEPVVPINVIIKTTKSSVEKILKKDPLLAMPDHQIIKSYYLRLYKGKNKWSKIS